ncbi:DUF1992 domain-containing protein [Streptomyces sparsogenes]|uniref:DnaJ family domain-containing protein n=1 Tax=Streptomyces sparsogenes TaxID=67365 RepID=UPI0033EC913F
MAERKPPGISFETWADRQIREAEARGDFDDLPGRGKPLRGLDKPYDPMWWVKEAMSPSYRWEVPPARACLMPPALVLRKEAEDALAAARAAGSEAEARRILADINDKIREALRRPPEGPPLDLVPFDVQGVLRERRASRAD